MRSPWCACAAGRRASFFFSSRRRHTRCSRDWSSDVCSSDLEDHLHLAAHRPQLVLAEGREVAPLEDDLPARRPLELEDAPAGRRLAAARLADEPEGLAAADRKAHVVHGTDDAGPPTEEPAADVEVFDEVPNLQERRVVVHVAAPLRATARSRFAASQHALTWPPPPMGTSLGRSTAQRSTWKAQRR